MTKFQIVLLSIFGFFIVLAVAVFALYKGGNRGLEATVVVWGDIPAEDLTYVVDLLAPKIDENLNIKYVEKRSDKIDKEFTEALARGEGPDLLIVSQDRLWKNKSKLMLIPYGSIGQRDFKDTFVEEGELFLTAEGIYGLPIAIDPMVLYYNRDILSSAGIAKPLSYWDEIYAAAGKLTQKDNAGNINQSTIALGETRNIKNYKEILSLLLLQAGTPITYRDNTGLRTGLGGTFDLPVAPAYSALDFYTQFANPAKTYYSWNRTMPEAQTRFTGGDLAYYLGFASELTLLKNKNPNLNFEVASVPQSRVAGRSLTYGKLSAVSISRGTKNPAAAMRAAVLMSSKDIAQAFAQKSGLPPARRDLLSQRGTDSVTPVLNNAALQSRGWLDPDNEATRTLFQDMIESVTSGRARTSEAVGSANAALENLTK